MISRENAVILGFVVVAMALYFATVEFTDWPFEVAVGILILVGAILPWVVNQGLDGRKVD